jgi:hypothetical protein
VLVIPHGLPSFSASLLYIFQTEKASILASTLPLFLILLFERSFEMDISKSQAEHE